MSNVTRILARLDQRLIKRYWGAHPVRRLQVGCGHRPFEGWLNADLNPFSASILRLNAARRLPFPDGSFQTIYSEHMIEHLTLAEARRFLAQCRRVLAPGGRIRLATPDLAFLAGLLGPNRSAVQEAYLRWAELEFLGSDGAGAAGVVNNFVRAWGHRFIFDEPALRGELARAGFGNIERYPLNESADPELAGRENEARLPPGFLRLETLVLEAVALPPP